MQIYIHITSYHYKDSFRYNTEIIIIIFFKSYKIVNRKLNLKM